MQKTYKVKKGDTYQSISKKLGIDPKQIISANKLKFPFRIKEGAILQLQTDTKKSSFKTKNIKKKIVSTPKKKIVPKIIKKSIKPVDKKGKKLVTKKSKSRAGSLKQTSKKTVARKTEPRFVSRNNKTVKTDINGSKVCFVLKTFLVLAGISIGILLIKFYISKDLINFKNSADLTGPSWYKNFDSNKDEKGQDEKVLDRFLDDVFVNTAPKKVGDNEKDDEKGKEEDKDIPVKEDIEIIILNGSGVKGKAGYFKNKLVTDNIKVIEVGNADNFKYNSTILQYPLSMSGKVILLETVLNEKGIRYKLQGKKDIEKITIIIGSDNI